MGNEKVLIVEDEEDILELLRYNLVRNGFRPIGARAGEEALKKLETDFFDVILLDLMLPGIDGLEVCRLIKQNNRLKSIPVVMITAKGEESDIVAGLELGADDYIVKPFSPAVVLARIRTVLRRKWVKKNNEESPLDVDCFRIHPGRREVFVNDVKIELTNLEFLVLYLLMKKPGWVFTRYQIVEGVRGGPYPVTDRSVDVVIVGLRKKLGEYGDRIETVRGVGYRFRTEEIGEVRLDDFAA